MTYQDDCTLSVELLEQLTREGLEGLPELVRVLVNEAMRIERQNYLGAPSRRVWAKSASTFPRCVRKASTPGL